MTDAPERIWAVPEYNCTVYMSGNSPITAQTGPFTHHRHGAAAKYIRADLFEALEAENHRLRATLSAITATDCYSRDECTAMARAALKGSDQ